MPLDTGLQTAHTPVSPADASAAAADDAPAAAAFADFHLQLAMVGVLAFTCLTQLWGLQKNAIAPIHHKQHCGMTICYLNVAVASFPFLCFRSVFELLPFESHQLNKLHG